MASLFLTVISFICSFIALKINRLSKFGIKVNLVKVWLDQDLIRNCRILLADIYVEYYIKNVQSVKDISVISVCCIGIYIFNKSYSPPCLSFPKSSDLSVERVLLSLIMLSSLLLIRIISFSLSMEDKLIFATCPVLT